MKGRTYNQEYSTQQDSSFTFDREIKFPRQAKVNSAAPNQLSKKC